MVVNILEVEWWPARSTWTHFESFILTLTHTTMHTLYIIDVNVKNRQRQSKLPDIKFGWIKT